jgi:chromosome partitioning protein
MIGKIHKKTKHRVLHKQKIKNIYLILYTNDIGHQKIKKPSKNVSRETKGLWITFDLKIKTRICIISDQEGENMLSHTKTISITNQKGGVGKTTTAINLATALASVGKNILVIDLDPQGNASTGFGITQDKRRNDTYSILFGRSDIDQSIQKTNIAGVDIIPASVDLSAAEVELGTTDAKTLQLKTLIDSTPRLGRYDFIFIDCPPALGFLTLNSLGASDSVLVPLQCEFFALEGISHLMNTISLVQQNTNPSLAIEGVLLTMFDKRNSLSSLVEQDVRECFGNLVFNTKIVRNVRVSEAPSHGKPVLLYDMECAGSKAYIELAAEFLTRNAHIEIKRAA